MAGRDARRSAALRAKPKPHDESALVSRGFRVEGDLWEAALDTADARGETLSEALRVLLRSYVKRNSGKTAG